jgi:hypothetical protein
MSAQLVQARVQPTRRCAWYGIVTVTNERLECDESTWLTGYYFREARHLRTLRLRLNGALPWLCSEGELRHDVLSAVFVYPELTQFEGGGTDAAGDRDWNEDAGITQRSIDIRAQLRVTPRELIVALDLANRSRHRVRLDAAWQLSADFADLQEALSGKREQTAAVDTACERGELVFRYAHPHLPLRTRVRAEGAAWQSASDGFTLSIELAPGEQHGSRLIVRPEDDGAPDEADAINVHAPHRDRVTPHVRPSAAPWRRPRGYQAHSRSSMERPANGRRRPGSRFTPLFGRDAAGWRAAMLDRGDRSPPRSYARPIARRAEDPRAR